jgi:hypothetical protein
MFHPAGVLLRGPAAHAQDIFEKPAQQPVAAVNFLRHPPALSGKLHPAVPFMPQKSPGLKPGQGRNHRRFTYSQPPGQGRHPHRARLPAHDERGFEVIFTALADDGRMCDVPNIVSYT